MSLKRIVAFLTMFTSFAIALTSCGGGASSSNTQQAVSNDPAFLTLTASPSSPPVVGTAVAITAIVKKSDMTPVADGTLVSFVATGGILSNLSAMTNGGTATTMLNATSAGTVVVTASAGMISSINSVSVTFGPLITVTANPAMISTTTGGTSTITATFKKWDGSFVPDGTVVHFSSLAGVLSAESAQTTGGVATVTLLVPAGVIGSGSVFPITATQDYNIGSAYVTILP